MHKWIVAAVFAAAFLGTAAVAQAQSEPDATATPMPREKYAIIDFGVTSRVLNQLNPGNYGSSFGATVGGELPFLGHSFDAVFDYTQYSYRHPSNNALANGLVAGCPAGDPGCVTPIGYQAYGNVAAGVAQYTTAFQAQDTEEHFGLGSKISRNTRMYLQTGWTWQSFNYTSMPPLSGWGLGIDYLPNLDKQLALYGGLWAYADMHGSYAAPALGGFAPGTLLVDYRMFTYHVGLTYALRNSPLFADAKLAGDRLDTRSRNDPSDIIHYAVSLGIGAHL